MRVHVYPCLYIYTVYIFCIFLRNQIIGHWWEWYIKIHTKSGNLIAREPAVTNFPNFFSSGNFKNSRHWPRKNYLNHFCSLLTILPIFSVFLNISLYMERMRSWLCIYVFSSFWCLNLLFWNYLKFVYYILNSCKYLVNYYH